MHNFDRNSQCGAIEEILEANITGIKGCWAEAELNDRITLIRSFQSGQNKW